MNKLRLHILHYSERMKRASYTGQFVNKFGYLKYIVFGTTGRVNATTIMMNIALKNFVLQIFAISSDMVKPGRS